MRLTITFVVIILIFACQEVGRVSKPDNLIAKTTMENILYDMAIITSARGHNSMTFSKTGVNPETYIFKKYKIDSIQYMQSILYYSSLLDEYKELIEKAKNRIESEHNELDSTYKKEKHILDSTRTVKEKRLAAERDSIKKIKYKNQEV